MPGYMLSCCSTLSQHATNATHNCASYKNAQKPPANQSLRTIARPHVPRPPGQAGCSLAKAGSTVSSSASLVVLLTTNMVQHGTQIALQCWECVWVLLLGLQNMMHSHGHLTSYGHGHVWQYGSMGMVEAVQVGHACTQGARASCIDQLQQLFYAYVLCCAYLAQS